MLVDVTSDLTASAGTSTPVVTEAAPATADLTMGAAATTPAPADVASSADAVVDTSAALTDVTGATVGGTSTAGVSKLACRKVILVKDLGAVPDIVGQTFSATTGVTHTFSYSNGASSELGVGFSLSGKIGTFKQSGTVGRSSTTYESYGTFGDHKGVYYQTYWHYGTFETRRYGECTDPAHYYSESFETRPIGFAGGANMSAASIPTNANTCVFQAAGTGFAKDSSRAITWTNGVSIKGAIGIDLSTKTGYSSNAHVAYQFNADRRLCGVSAYPGENGSYLLVAR
jgi:hypothetical protein